MLLFFWLPTSDEPLFIVRRLFIFNYFLTMVALAFVLVFCTSSCVLSMYLFDCSRWLFKRSSYVSSYLMRKLLGALPSLDYTVMRLVLRLLAGGLTVLRLIFGTSRSVKVGRSLSFSEIVVIKSATGISKRFSTR